MPEWLTWLEWLSEHRLLALLLTLSVLDVVTGLSAAAIQGSLNSKVSWHGANRKFLTLAAVCTALAVERLGSDIVGGLPIAFPVTAYYCSTELISIIENLRDSGVPVPKALTDILAKFEDRERLEEAGKRRVV